MKAKLLDLDSKELGEVKLSKDIFGIEVKEEILNRVVEWQRAKRRAGTRKTKGQSEVSGTTKKPHAQKGTGKARLGSLRVVQCRGGGVAHGPVVRSHECSLPKKVRKLGLKMALSAKMKNKDITFIKDLKLSKPKTSELVKKLKKMSSDKMLFIDKDDIDKNFVLAAKNIPNVDVLPQIGANVYDILNCNRLVITEEAVRILEERL